MLVLLCIIYICHIFLFILIGGILQQCPDDLTQLHMLTPGNCLVQPQSDLLATEQFHRSSVGEDTQGARGPYSSCHCLYPFVFQVYFDENPTVDNVYTKDFFHEVFHEMVSTESGMFMFNDSKTLAWFPSSVRLQNYLTKNMYQYYFQCNDLRLNLSLPSTPGNTGAPEVLPVWGSMWTGFVQPVHHILALPNGTVQEAAWCKTFTGGHDGIQSTSWEVSGSSCKLDFLRFVGLGVGFSKHKTCTTPVFKGVCSTSWKTTMMMT